MVDIVSLGALIIASITAIGTILHQIHLKNCSCFCINSKCVNSEPNTPLLPPIIKS